MNLTGDYPEYRLTSRGFECPTLRNNNHFKAWKNSLMKEAGWNRAFPREAKPVKKVDWKDYE